MVEEIEALEKKLFIEEIALNVTEDRCDFLDNNYRLLYSCLMMLAHHGHAT